MKCSVLLIAASLLIAGIDLNSPALSQTLVPIDRFRSVQFRGGGRVYLRRGPEQQVRLLHGSTRFTRFHVGPHDQLIIDACNEDCPSRYDLDIEIITPRIDGIAISGGGKIESEAGFGRQGSVDAAIEGGGLIDIRSIDAMSANAAVDGGGNIELRADQRLSAAVNGGGNVLYWGNPAVTSAVDGGGSVSRGD